MRPVKELEQLRMNHEEVPYLIVKDGENVILDADTYELMELDVTLVSDKAKQYGIKICQSDDEREETVIYYDYLDKKLKVDLRKSSIGFGPKVVEAAPLVLKPDEPLNLRIFIDKSIVEVFANDRQAISRRIYPTLGGKGISLFSKGGDMEVKSIEIWEMMPSNAY